MKSRAMRAMQNKIARRKTRFGVHHKAIRVLEEPSGESFLRISENLGGHSGSRDG